MIGDTIRRLRTEKGLTQRELAKLLGISPSTIGMYEQNRREPDLTSIENMSKLFDVTADYLLGISDIKNNPLKTKQVGDGLNTENQEELKKYADLLMLRQTSEIYVNDKKVK